YAGTDDQDADGRAMRSALSCLQREDTLRAQPLDPLRQRTWTSCRYGPGGFRRPSHAGCPADRGPAGIRPRVDSACGCRAETHRLACARSRGGTCDGTIVIPGAIVMTAEPSKALAHIRVLDISRARAGPTCVRILGDFGAHVIKIEAPPGVDPNEGISGARDGYDMINLHRNKRSLTLNLKERTGREIFMRLVRDADVVVENFRPDVKERMGIAYEALSALNPRIILASISGFGQSGPYRSRAGFDQIAQGMGGLMGVTGMPGTGPTRAGIAVADSSAGVYAATGILIALAERERSGRGQWVHTSLLEAQIAMMDFQAARYLVDGVVPEQAGNHHPYSTPMGVFPTADGFINIGVGGDGQWRALCVALGRPELGTVADYA